MNYGDIDGELLAKTYREVTLSGILLPITEMMKGLPLYPCPLDLPPR